jgi:hypothetical protein
LALRKSKLIKQLQEAYDLGWKHGHEIGKVDKHNEILGLLVDNIETINWVKEDPIEVRDIIPLVRKGVEEPVEVIDESIDVWASN